MSCTGLLAYQQSVVVYLYVLNNFACLVFAKIRLLYIILLYVYSFLSFSVLFPVTTGQSTEINLYSFFCHKTCFFGYCWIMPASTSLFRNNPSQNKTLCNLQMFPCYISKHRFFKQALGHMALLLLHLECILRTNFFYQINAHTLTHQHIIFPCRRNLTTAFVLLF